MAKLGAYYSLCPLIDHRSLLGISPDAESGVVIVTLGKNIAIKYKLLDQKQLYSWRTKDKFSSPIIYDVQESHYVAVFNDSFLRIWKGNEEFLDKLKKLKFSQQIHTVFLCNGKTYIVFKCGVVMLLNEAIQNRRGLLFKNIILESEYIADILHINFNKDTYIGLLVKSNENCYLYWTKFNESEIQSKYCKISLQQNAADLRGYAFHVDKISVKLFTLWNDGRMYSSELKEGESHYGELFAVIDFMICKEYVSILCLDPNYIVMYGCNSNDEGALLAIYNVQFKVVQTRQSFKLFTNEAKLWNIGRNLFFPVGQNLAVVPFLLDLEQLAALIGSHRIIESIPDPDVSIVHKVQFVNWGQYSQLITDTSENLVESKIRDFVAQGINKNMIIEIILSDLLEHKNIEILSHIISYFDDIPEHSLVKLLKLILSIESKLFKLHIGNNFAEKVHQTERVELLDLILTKSFNETLLLSHLRSYLTLDEVLILLQYIYFLFSEEGHTLPLHTFMETETRLTEWSCILLDANYQKLILTRDKNIIKILVLFRDMIKRKLGSGNISLLACLLQELKKGKSLQKSLHVSSSNYTIEEFPLY